MVVWASIWVVLPLARAADDAQIEQLKAQLKAQIDSEVGAIKKDYEERIKALEQRVETVEAENAQLRGQQAQATTTKPAAPATSKSTGRCTML